MKHTDARATAVYDARRCDACSHSVAAPRSSSTACGGDDAPEERRFEQDGAPFAFAYPPDLITIQPQLRETERSAPTFKTSVGTDEANYVHVATYDTKVPVDLAEPGEPEHGRSRRAVPGQEHGLGARRAPAGQARAARRVRLPAGEDRRGARGPPDLRLQRPGGVLRALRVGVRRLPHHPGRLRPGAAVVRAARRRRHAGRSSQPATTTAPASSSGSSRHVSAVDGAAAECIAPDP